jgi:competence protein ComEA
VKLNNWQGFISKTSTLDKVLIIILILGTSIVGIGLFKGIVEDSQVQVEVIKDKESAAVGKVVVDVGGAVVSPGVYELLPNSRIKDALVAAGGLSEDADRDYVQKTINLAENLKDAQKIFIPKLTKNISGVGYPEAKYSSGKVNINQASEQELDTLTGIGSIRAKAIIDSRPYGSVDDLVNKGVISKSILDKLKDKIVAY